MSVAFDAAYARKLFAWSGWVAVLLVMVAMAVEGRPGVLSAGVLLGAAGSFAVLALRMRSVLKVIGASSRGEAARAAFLHSLSKLAVAFVVLAVGAQMGTRGALGTLAGLMATPAATFAEGLYVAVMNIRGQRGHRWR